jgi:DNA topoisomerase-1
MAKKYTTTTTLVLVESPAKCKKIESFLGPGYKCMATFGHIRDLQGLKNIDVENNFRLTFKMTENDIKQKQLEKIRKEILKCDEVIIATDGDREGESIGWHICDLFNLNLEKTKRIIFQEITETAIQNAVKSPKIIDINIVLAQQARQVLDLLVGFKISPILWKYISKNKDNGLSAGRCQTPTLKLVYDNFKEIEKNPGNKIYNTTGYFTNHCIPFSLNNNFENENDMVDFLENSITYDHIYSCSLPKNVSKNPPEPFITSRLQQVASNLMHISPKETMKICQALYEGGFITYMRTDSKKYSAEFIESTKNYILKNYEKNYVNPNILDLVVNLNKDSEREKDKDKDKLIQEAHEAIRPTNISLKELSDKMDSKEKKLYKIIWENTIESCMSPALFLSITASINAYNNNKYIYNCEQVSFPGWKIISKKYDEEELEDDNDSNKLQTKNNYYNYLLTIKKESVIKYKKITSKITLKNTKLHYTEAKLVQLLEEKGIGRPSTFSMLIDKIQERGYVKKENIKGKEVLCKDYELENDDIYEIETTREFGNEKNKLIIQPLGILVIEFLEKNFNELFEYNYTKNMEDDLDLISNGQKIWHELCRSCFDKIDHLINELEGEKKLEIKIDDIHTLIVAKHGFVIKCIENDGVSFKSVIKDIDINKLKNNEYKLEELLESEREKEKDINNKILGKYENEELVIKKGKYGLYASWGKNSKTLNCFGNRPIENITYLDVVKILDKDGNMVREINDNVSIRKGKYGDYIFYKTKKMRKPAFYKIEGFEEDYKKCNKDLIKIWLRDKYNIVDC